jgi:hypothetical protein
VIGIELLELYELYQGECELSRKVASGEISEEMAQMRREKAKSLQNKLTPLDLIVINRFLFLLLLLSLTN